MNPKIIEMEWEELKAARMPLESGWQMIRDYFAPHKTTELETPKGEHIKRRIRSSTAMNTLSNYQAKLIGYLVDPTQPFLIPQINEGRVTSSRRLDLSDASKDYLDSLGWALYDWLMNPRSNFLSSLSRATYELGLFGSAIIWTGHKRGFGPIYQCRPMRASWFAVNEDDVPDTYAFQYEMSLWRLFSAYPEAKNLKVFQKYDVEKEKNKKIKLLHMVRPRAGGKIDGFANQKPFANIIVAPDDDYAVLEESGFNEFPFSIPRTNPIDGAAYGRGPASFALPPAVEAARLEDYMSYGFGRLSAPVEFAPMRLFSKTHSRVPGSTNYYETKALGFMSFKDAFQTIDFKGDPNAGMIYLEMLKKEIVQPFEMEFSKLRDAGNVSAEEVRYRRQLDMTGQIGTLVAVDRDLFSNLADRSLGIFALEGYLATPPEEIAGKEVRFDYKGPLRSAQQEPVVAAYQRLIELSLLAAQIDPEAVHVVSAAEGLRVVAEAMGAPPTMTRSREDVNERLKAEQERMMQAEQVQMAQGEAQAARDLGQAIGSIANAGELGANQGMAA